MKKLIAAMNMTLDGFCDHTAGIADEELHQHYADLLKTADAILYGRVTYQLMEYWRSLLENPTGEKAMDDFALVMDRVPKIVFSRTLKALDWDSARLATKSLEDEVAELKNSGGDENKNIYVGSPGLIAALTQSGLIEEYQICIHPFILGSGLTLFKNISQAIPLKLQGSKTFNSGAIILYYQRIHK